MRKIEIIKLFVLALFVGGVAAVLLTDNFVNPRTHAFSSGPPPAYTGAPGDIDSCLECHLFETAGNGRFTISAPPTYVPGQTYRVTVSHENSDPTRLRWGFQLTALTQDQLKAGELKSTDATTQVITGGPMGARQYIEHTANGYFANQRNGANWSFDWTAPAVDVGPVTFYAAGNQANGDGNTSGDFIFTTFVSSLPASTPADISITASPSPLTVSPGATAVFNLTTAPTGNFRETVNFSLAGLPSEATATFSPASVTFDSPFPINSTLTIRTAAAIPPGTYPLTITGLSQSVQRSTTATLVVTGKPSADLSITKTGSPNPSAVGVNLTYRITVTNNGPSPANNVTMTDALPANLTFISATPGQGSCAGTTTVVCNFGNLPRGASATAQLAVRPTLPGPISNTATIVASETDPQAANNAATVVLTAEPSGTSPTLLDPTLAVKTTVSGLDSPIGLAFLGADDLLVIEKGTGRVRRVVNGQIQATVLDLAVNNASERGLLGIALHPAFADNRYVYLFWTESSTGQDTSALGEVATLGNRVDRYVWNGAELKHDRTLIRLRAFQADAGQPLRGNHNGGVLRFGPDGKLYLVIGDNGRRGYLQNLLSGSPVPDDQFGGPAPDDAHLTGVILRLNDDGTTPADNPFYATGATTGGEAGLNLQRIYAYGVRNSFGMAFDPVAGHLWTQENGDDSFDEINRVEAGFNGGWTQVMGPASRVAEFKAIEVSRPGGLQQNRWPASLIADTPADALNRLYALPGARYTDPEFSWKYAVAPSPIGFVRGRGLGAQYEGDLIVGASRTFLYGGFLFRLKLAGDRRSVSTTDPRLADKVADNLDKFDITESESLLLGRDFGVTTDIQTGPNGDLYVVSLSNGAVYQVYSTAKLFVARLSGAQEVPANASTALGTATLLLSEDEKTARVSLSFGGLMGSQTASHIHGPAAPGSNANVIAGLPVSQFTDHQINLTPAQVQDLRAGLLYLNVHSSAFPDGEIRGQFALSSESSVVQLEAASYSVPEDAGSVQFAVVRLGDTSRAASVNYATSDTAGVVNCGVREGKASARCDYAAASGTLAFAPGEARRTFTLSVIDDAYVEGAESFSLALGGAAGAALGAPATATLKVTDNDAVTAFNPIGGAPYFVRQHYVDFLNREPEPAGFDAWLRVLNNCAPGNPACDRVEVSSSFFRSPEFQERGFFIYKFYAAALGRLPRYDEFLPDMRRVSGALTPAEAEAARLSFAADFTTRAEFRAKYDALAAPAYVDALLSTAGVTLASRDQLVADLQSGARTRAEVLRVVVESAPVAARFFNEAFVVMQYFGYLRRDPDVLYLNWIRVLNTTGDYRVMVNGFVNSVEYRARFGQP